MSSSSEGTHNNGDGESGSNDHAQWFKKRRLQSACDLCRRRKVRCDGNQMSDSRCSNCVAHKSSCTYIEAMKRNGPLEKYVDYLEKRVEKLEQLEQLLRKLPPDSDLLKELNGFFDSSEVQMSRASTDDEFLSVNALVLPPQGIRLSTQRPMDGRALKEEQEDDGLYDVLADNFSHLSIDPTERLYYGKSSTPMLVQTAIEVKNDFATKRNNSTTEPVISNERQRCWDVKPWRLETEVHKFQFPPGDFIPCLIDLYFDQINLFFPLLHRPTFERSVAERLHHTDYWFGALLLLVCATGAQYADDSRVLLDGEVDYCSSGWRWFQQVQLALQSIPRPPNVYNLQLHCLTIRYLQSTSRSASQSCWVMLGTAIRLAQNGGTHLKRKKDVETWTLEDELQIRAFWVLVSMDIDMSCALGRPCVTQAENFDLDYPLEVDDDYWEHEDPKQSFKQPQGKPSLTTAFNLLLKLYHLRAFALRTIYSITRSKMRLGYIGDDWKQHIITELDSALNKWVDGIPDYLRWDPNRENQQYFRQSVLLYTHYYYVRIQIHRPFIPPKSSLLSFPSLIICTSAARSCSNIIDVMRKRQLEVVPFVQLQAFTSGVILLLNFWSSKGCGLSSDPQKEISDVYKCMEVLRVLESRWNSAGRLLDALERLASVGDPSFLNANSPMSHSKRDRQGDILDTRHPGTLAETPGEPRVIAGSQRVSRAVSHVEIIAAAHLLHEQSITPQLHQQHIEQHQASRQPHQPLSDLSLNTNHHQGQEHLNFVNQSSSSFTGAIAQHDRNVHHPVYSCLPSGVNADTGHQTTWFTYHQLELSTLTRSEAQTQVEMQTTAYNPIVSTGTAMSGMEVMGRSLAAQGSTANQAQWWHDSGPASSTASSDFQFQNWAGRPGIPYVEHKHPKTSQHHPQLRQVRTGPSAGSPHPFPPQRDHRPHGHHDQQALPALQPFITHPQQSQPTAIMHRRDIPPSPPTFMQPPLSPQQQPPTSNYNTLQMRASTYTSSELANWRTY